MATDACLQVWFTPYPPSLTVQSLPPHKIHACLNLHVKWFTRVTQLMKYRARREFSLYLGEKLRRTSLDLVHINPNDSPHKTYLHTYREVLIAARFCASYPVLSQHLYYVIAFMCGGHCLLVRTEASYK